MNDTDQLIDSLAARAGPVQRLSSPLWRTVQWVALAALVVAAIVVFRGVRPDFAQRVVEPGTAIEWVASVLTGVLAAYAGGRVDALLMRLVDLLLSFPTILMALMILAYMGKGISNVILTLVLLEWAYYARTARGQALVEARREYVDAARGQGLPAWRILVGHVLPNCLPPLLVIGALQVARAITLEATLSFLGLGIQPPTPSWGGMVQEGREYLDSAWWISAFPGLVLMLTSVAVSRTGDWLRDLLDPTLRGE